MATTLNPNDLVSINQDLSVTGTITVNSSSSNIPHDILCMHPDLVKKFAIMIGGVPELVSGVMVELHQHYDDSVRAFVVANQHTPHSCLVFMQDDVNYEIAEMAMRRVRMIKETEE